MATAARSADAGAAERDRGKTPAQLFSYIIGAVLVLAGILGFFADGDFNTGKDINGDTLLGLEVNGIHNLVHIGSGLLLLALAPKRATAKTGALLFGVIYVVVTIIGFADGRDVLTLLPVNAADNVLHLVLAIVAIAAALLSRGDDRAETRRA
jgi:hypothetical protein